MFIELELWKEHSQVKFGKRADATLNMKPPSPTQMPVNLCQITSYEPVKIETIGRPGTPDNKCDILKGFRILLASGAIYVVIDDREGMAFTDALVAAKHTETLIVELGKSDYMKRFSIS